MLVGFCISGVLCQLGFVSVEFCVSSFCISGVLCQ